MVNSNLCSKQRQQFIQLLFVYAYPFNPLSFLENWREISWRYFHSSGHYLILPCSLPVAHSVGLSHMPVNCAYFFFSAVPYSAAQASIVLSGSLTFLSFSSLVVTDACFCITGMICCLQSPNHWGTFSQQLAKAFSVSLSHTHSLYDSLSPSMP